MADVGGAPGRSPAFFPSSDRAASLVPPAPGTADPSATGRRPSGRRRPASPWRPLALSALLVLLNGVAPSAAAEGGSCTQLDELVSGLEALDSAHDPQWLGLGHYREDPVGRWVSEVDGSTFFLAPTGKADPTAELVATLRALCAAPDPSAPESHASCRFPARARWIRERLSLPPRAFPDGPCAARDEFLDRVGAVSTTLIFSAYYLNNPVSAFGHTFLRIDSEASTATSAKQELLDYGIDYAAVTGGENAILYAFKGLFGFFQGKFSAMPYFYKVRKYNDMESRDIWEYNLSLSAEQSRFLTEHLWELGQTYLDYWYLDENCSYHILGALETVLPEAGLVERLSFPVLPANTVKAVVDQPGLVRNVAYRPSIRSQFRARLQGLAPADRALVLSIVQDPSTETPADYPAPKAAQVLDAAIDLVEMRHFRELVENPGGQASGLKQRILEKRAAVGVATPDLALPPPAGEMPHLGHGSRRAGLALGYSADQGEFVSVHWRLAMHDLLDPAAGYPQTAGVEFLPLEVRYFPREGRIHLEEAYAVRVASLTPRDEFDRSFSWKLAVGATTIRDEGCRDGCAAAHVGAGAGLAGAWLDGTLLTFATLDGDVLGTTQLEGGIGGRGVRVGLGPAMGLLYRHSPGWATMTGGKWSYLPGQDPAHTWRAEFGTRWSVGRNLAVGLQADSTPEDVAGAVRVTCYF